MNMRMFLRVKMLRSGVRSVSKPHTECFMQIALRLLRYKITIQRFHDESDREPSFCIHRNIFCMDVFSSENIARTCNGQMQPKLYLCV